MTGSAGHLIRPMQGAQPVEPLLDGHSPGAPGGDAPGVRESECGVPYAAHAVEPGTDSHHLDGTVDSIVRIPVHTKGYGGVCIAAPTATPSRHVVSSTASSACMPPANSVSSIVCRTGSRRYSGSAIARNSWTDVCSRTSTTHPEWL